MPVILDGHVSIGRRAARVAVRLAAMATAVSVAVFVAILLGWARDETDLSYAAYFLIWLGSWIGLGLATGYLVATWHGREMRAYLMMWGTFGGAFGFAAVLALIVYIFFTYPVIVLAI